MFRYARHLPLGLELLGAGVILTHGVPFYRLVIAGPFQRGSATATIPWAMGAVVAVQTGYWLRQSRPASSPRLRHALPGHLLIFLARLLFTFVSALFSAVFLVHFESVHLDLWRFLLLLAVLFSVFCVSRDVEALGQGLLPAPRPSAVGLKASHSTPPA